MGDSEIFNRLANYSRYKRGGINEGVHYDNGRFVFDFSQDSLNDIISLTDVELYESTIFQNVYYFGYKFNADVDSRMRTEFITQLKNIKEKTFSEKDYQRFIEKPLLVLNQKCQLAEVDCIIYPVSQRTELNRQMMQYITKYATTHKYTTFEMVKNVPQEITFDRNRFFHDNQGKWNDKQMQQMMAIIDELVNAIHNLDYFSIARDVKKTKYRPYIDNYLSFKNAEEANTFKMLNAKKILVLDDINTTGSTLQHIIKIIKNINVNSEIYIFTLIGKEN